MDSGLVFFFTDRLCFRIYEHIEEVAVAQISRLKVSGFVVQILIGSFGMVGQEGPTVNDITSHNSAW